MFLQQQQQTTNIIPQLSMVGGGGGTGTVDGCYGSTTTAAQTALNVMEAEVPNELLAQLSTLENAIRENRQLYAQIKDTNPASELQELGIKMAKLGRLITQQKSAIKTERMRSAALAEKIGLDHRIAQNIEKSRSDLQQQQQQLQGTAGMGGGGVGGMANPMMMNAGTASAQYGGRIIGIVPHPLDYLHEIALINERQLEEQWATVERLRHVLHRLLDENEQENTMLSRRDLANHIQRFDKIFESVALQVYALSEAGEKLRDSFMEQSKLLVGSAIGDPFEKRKQRQKMVDVYSALKGVDAFPSPNAIMSLSEFLPKQHQLGQIPGHPQPQFGATPFAGTGGIGTFGAGGGGTSSLFCPRPTAPPAFSFNQPAFGGAPGALISTAASSAAAAPLFGGGTPKLAATQAGGGGLFGGGTPVSTASTTTARPQTALPGAVTAAPSFPLLSGQQPQLQQATVPPFGFSNTLSSASSGTLFKGSAPAPATTAPFGTTTGSTRPAGGLLSGAK